jgi:predicted RNA-binding Zn-ribbon protein involved in translation (DUF1610 family)
MDETTVEMECPDCGQEGELDRTRYEQGYRGRCPKCQRSMIASDLACAADAKRP